jgi:hypothetical protein
MFTDISSIAEYPKNLIIRNHLGGMIWQVYKVEKYSEADQISANATRNGFEAITLEDYDPKMEETFPDWRESKGGKEIINK